MFLVDTNVWVEVLLGQEKAKEASDFLKRTPASDLSLNRFFPLFHRHHIVQTWPG